MNILPAITTILLCTLFFSFPAACAFSESGDVQSLKGWLPKQSVQTDSRKNINNPEPDAYSDGDGNYPYADLPVDCSKISSPVESAICSDNDLLALDYFMSHIWVHDQKQARRTPSRTASATGFPAISLCRVERRIFEAMPYHAILFRNKRFFDRISRIYKR